jgi:hypothetical protein
MPQIGSQSSFGQNQFGGYFRLGLSSPSASKTASGAFSARGHYILNGSAAKVAVPGETILTNFGRFVKGIDLATQALKDAVEGAITNWNLKVYISDGSSNPKWVDLTDQAEWRGKNMLRAIGRLEYSAERRVGALQQRMANVTFDNSDGFWSRPWAEDAGNGSGWTNKIRASFDASWNFLDDTITTPGNNPAGISSASDTRWFLSQNGEQTALFHHKIALRAEFQVNGGATETATLGLFVIEKKVTDGEARTCSLTLAPLSKALTEGNKAESVKEGTGWYRNKSPKFLVEELLKEEYADATGNLPDLWLIEDITGIDVPLDGRDRWVSSHLGRPPERTVDGDNLDDAEWISDPVQTCRAMCLWEHNAGVVSVTPGSAVVTGTTTGWNTGPRLGDPFIIPKEFTSGDGGSTLGNDGRYTIIDIGGDLSLTLDRPVEGSAVEGSLSYTIPRLYLGVGHQLYEYNISTDTYISLGDASSIYPLRNIIRLWHNTGDTTYPIWGVAIADLGGGDNGLMEGFEVFRFRWDGDTPDLDIWGDTAGFSVSHSLSMFSGQWISREADKHDGQFRIGNHPGSTDQAPVTTPFRQYMANMRSGGASWFLSFPGSEADFTSESSSPSYLGGVFTEQLVGSNQRHWHIETNDSGTTPITVRYSSGQQGFIVLNPNYGTKGGIVFARIGNAPIPTHDSSTAEDTAPEYDFEFSIINLGQTLIYGPPNFWTLDEELFTITGSDYDQGFLPTAGCSADGSSGLFYVALSRYNQAIGTEGIQTSILSLDFETTSNPSGSLLLNGTVAEVYEFPVADEMIITEMVDGPNSLFAVAYDPKNAGVRTAPIDDFYHIFAFQSGTRYDVYSTKSMIQAMVYMHNGAPAYGEDGSDKFYFHEPERGRINYVEDTGDTLLLPGQTPTLVSSLPAVPGDPYVLNSQIVASSSIRELYWTSSSAPFFVVANRTEGRFYLSKWSPVWPARIELADFSGMSIWDALSAVAEVIGARFGFNPDGTFFFRLPPLHSNPVYTFTNLSASRLLSLTRDEGYDDIINEAIRVPFESAPGDVDVNLTLGVDSKASDYSLDALHITEKPVTARLYCEVGGDADSAAWSYTITRGTVNTTTSIDYTSGANWIYVSDPVDLVYGTILTGKTIDASNNEITLTGRVGDVLNYSGGGDLITDVTLGVNSSSLSVASGSFNLTTADTKSRQLAVGDLILMANFGAETGYEYMQVTSVSASSLGVSRGWLGTPAIEHAAGHAIAIIRQGKQVALADGMKDAAGNPFGLNSGDELEATFPDADRWSRSLNADPAVPASGLATTGGSWTGTDGDFVAIGDHNGPYSTGLSLRLTSSSSPATEFQEGDLIVVEAPGISLVEQHSSLSRFSDRQSQARFGKKVDDGNGKFLPLQPARWKTMQLVQESAWPKYRFTAQTVMTPWIFPLDVVSVQDQNLLPRASEFKVPCYVSSISFDLMTGGLQTLGLKAIEAH